ncbi:hypothetical protein AB2N08_03875 [Massilia aurea]|uniref:hypothetical protein n=1 Tax=Massilia aurea TaxID=373040 RepID=UPI003463064E
MNIVKLTLLASIALTSVAAMAQQTIVAASPASSVSFDLYPTPDASQSPREIKVSEAGLPLPVLARQGGFLKVDIGGQPVWIRSAKVRVSRTSTANCGALASHAALKPTASTPGAADVACTKAN